MSLVPSFGLTLSIHGSPSHHSRGVRSGGSTPTFTWSGSEMTLVTSAHSLLVRIRIWLCLVAKGLRNAGGICVFGELSMSLLQKSFIIQKNYCLLLALFCFFLFVFFWPCCTAYGISVPWQGLEPRPWQWVPNPNHETTRELSALLLFGMMLARATVSDSGSFIMGAGTGMVEE